MILTERHIIKKQHCLFEECDSLAFLSKNLYNKANYIIRQEFIHNHNYLNYYDINRIMIDTNDVDYRALPVKVANNILQLLHLNWKSFYLSLVAFRKNPKKFNGFPKLPKYKHKTSGRNIVPYEKNAISKRELIKNNKIKLSKTNIVINPKEVNYENLQSARIVPRLGHYVVEIMYNVDIIDAKLNKNNIVGIDLGVNNLATIVSTTTGDSFIVNGRPIKSINQFYNKRTAFLQSKLDNQTYSSHRINKLTNKRNNKINDYLHKASRYIIEYCLTNDIGKIVIGNNKGWKQNINIGKSNNQNFVGIPFYKFIQMIQYKAELLSIEVIVHEEAYTSKCSFIDNEKIGKHTKYKGQRVKRGMFKSENGIIINADVNGAYNIIRKVVSKFNFSKLKNGIEGVAVYPVRYNFS